MVLNIYKLHSDEKVLRTVSTPVEDFNGDLRQFTDSMVETMFAANGVGLAAPQVGHNINMFVMRTEEGLRKDNQDHRVLINPHTVIEVGEMIIEIEGCLSIPRLQAKVGRYPEVGCIYWDATGQRHGLTFKGLEARIYQHEADHLFGTLFIDRAERF